MIRFTDTETDMIYQVDAIDDEIHLYYRCDEESSFRVVPMSRSAAAVLGKTLMRYVMPAAAPETGHVVIPPSNVVAFPAVPRTVAVRMQGVVG